MQKQWQLWRFLFLLHSLSLPRVSVYPHRSRAAIWWNRPRHKWHLSTSYLWPINIRGEGFGCVNEVISARGWKIDVCVWCCCRFVWNELSGGGLAAVPTHDATDRKSVFLWTRAFHGSLADPSFCLLLLRRFSLFWKIFGSLWNTDRRYYVFWLICFSFYANIKSLLSVFQFLALRLDANRFLFTMFDT